MKLQHAVAYGIEIARYSGHYRAELDTALGSSAQVVQDELANPLACAGFGVLGASAFDIAIGEKRTNSKDRDKVRHLAAVGLHLSDLTDDLIDETEVPLAGPEKAAVLESIAKLFTSQESQEYENPMFEAAVVLGRYATNELGTSPSFIRTAQNYAVIESKFGINPSFEDTLQYVWDLGTITGDVVVSPLEAVSGRTFPDVSVAYQALCRYAVLLDHAYEVADDLKEKTPSLVTVQFSAGKATLQEIKEAREVCIELANDQIGEGEKHLDRRQLPRYRAIHTLLDIRYRLMRRSDDKKINELLNGDGQVIQLDSQSTIPEQSE